MSYPDASAVSAAIARGDALLASAELDAADAEYRTALGLDPKSAEALYSRGCVAQRRGKWADALAWAQRALGQDPVHRGGQSLAGSTLLQLSRYAEALEQLEPLLDDRDSGEIRVEIALCYEGLGDLGRAEQELRQVLADDPAYLTRYSAVAMYGQQPYWADIHAHLARVLQRQGSDEEARLHYHLAKRIDPTVDLYPGYLEIMRREDLEDHPIDRLEERAWLDELDLSGYGEQAESVRTLLGLSRLGSANELNQTVSELPREERNELIPLAVTLIHSTQRTGLFQLSARLRAVGDTLAGEDDGEPALFDLLATTQWLRLFELAEKLEGGGEREPEGTVAAAAREDPRAPERLLALARRFDGVDTKTGLALVRVVATALTANVPHLAPAAQMLVGQALWRSGDLAAAESQLRAGMEAADDVGADAELLGVLDLLARVQAERGHDNQAAATFRRQVVEADRMADPDHRILSRYNLAVTSVRLGERATARTIAEEAAQLAKDAGRSDLGDDIERLLSFIASGAAPGSTDVVSPAQESYERACRLHDDGRTDEALRELEQAYESALAESNADLAREALVLQGGLCAETGQYGRARRYLEESLHLAPIHRLEERARIHLTLARVLTSMADPEEAVTQFRAALASAQRAGAAVFEVLAHEAFGAALAEVDPEASRYHEERVRRALAPERSATWQEFTDLAARAATSGAKSREAETLLGAMLAALDALNDTETPRDRAEAALITGTAMLESGQPAQAEQPLRQALTIATSTQDRDIEVEVAARRYLGTSYRLTGRYTEAVEEYRTAQGLVERVGEELDAADLNGRLAIALRYNGELDEAVEAYQASIATYHHYVDTYRVAVNQMNLAQTLFLLGRRTQGLTVAAEALEEFDHRDEQDFALRTLALLADQSWSESDLPERLMTRLQQSAAASSDPIMMAWSRRDEANWLLAEGDSAAAEDALGQAIAIFQDSQDIYNEIKAWLYRARLLTDRRPTTALADAAYARELAEATGHGDLTAEADERLLLLALARGDLDAAATLHEALVTHWNGIRRRLHRDSDRVTLTGDAVRITKYCAQHYLAAGDNMRSADALDLARALGLTDMLAIRSGRTERTAGSSGTAKRLLRALGAPAVAISLDLLDRDVVVGMLRPEDREPSFERTGFTHHDVTELLETFHEEMLVYRGRSAQTWPDGLRLLFGPALAELRPDEQVVLLPDSDLQGLPLHATPTPGGSPLIADHPVAYAPSFAAIDAVRSRPAGMSDRWAVSVGVAFPDEARAISLILGGSCLSGRHLDKQDVRAAVTRAPLVHVACHGYFDTQDFLDSGLLLHVTDSPIRDDILSLRDLEDWTMAAELVVLSACETGYGRAAPSDFLSLARGILGAGARAVIATLWPVDDAMTQTFMLEFYRELMSGRDAEGGFDLASALARTQRIASRERQVYDWAAFKLIGWPRMQWNKPDD